MTFNPLDYLKNLVPENTNMFGASPNANMEKMAKMGLLGDASYEDMLAKANKQSIFQGLLSSGLAYAAQPKNQGYGSIFPYLAKAGLAGVQAAQSPYDQMGKDAMMSQQLEAMKRAKDLQGKQDLFRKNYPLTGGTTQIDPNQQVPLAPFRTGTLQNDSIGSTLMGAPEFNQPRVNGMPLPNEVAPMFDVINTNPMDALNRGVSPDQLKTTEVAPDSELARAEQAFQSEVISYGDLMTEKARIAEAAKPSIKDINPEHDVYIDGVLTKKGVKPDNLTNLMIEYKAAQNDKKYPYKGSLMDFKKEFVPNTTVNVNGQETIFETASGKQVLELGEKARHLTYNMPKIDKAVAMLYKDISRVDGKVIYTGMAKELQLQLARAGDVLKNARKSDPTITDTQLMDMAFNSDVFPLIKQLGIGARGMDTVAERTFLIESMVGSLAMTPEALLQATLDRRARLIDDAYEFNKNFESDGFKLAREKGVLYLDEKFNEKYIRGPVVKDIFNPKIGNGKTPLQEHANGDITNPAIPEGQKGHLVYEAPNAFSRSR